MWLWILEGALILSRRVLDKPRIRVGNFLFLTDFQHAIPVVKHREVDCWGEMFDILGLPYNGSFLLNVNDLKLQSRPLYIVLFFK